MTDVAAVKIDPKKTAVAKEYKHDRPLTACFWEPQGRFVFFGAEDNLCHRYEISSGNVVPLSAHDSWIRAFSSSPDGETLYTGGYDGRLISWPTAADKPQPARTIQAHAGWLRALTVSPDGKYIASCGNDLLVKLWDASTGTLVKAFKGHASHVYNVAFSSDSSSLYSCDLKGVVNAWSLDTEAPRTLATVEALHKYDTTFRADIGGARDIALRSDGKQLALGGITNVTNAFAGVGELAVALVNLTEPKLDLVLESKDKQRGTIWGVAHHPDGFWIGLGGGNGGWLYFWKGDTKHEFFRLKLKSDGRGLSLSPDRTQLAVAHADKHLRTYNIFV